MQNLLRFLKALIQSFTQEEVNIGTEKKNKI